MVVRVYVCVCGGGKRMHVCFLSFLFVSVFFAFFSFFLYLVVGVYLIFILKQMIAWFPSWLLVGNYVLGMF